MRGVPAVIVDPDFMDHWRTGMVADALGDHLAPVYILRLWAHCQERKSDRFNMPTRGLKAQCKFPGDAELFEAALIEAGFIERNGADILVCGWAEKNASLIAAWENGSKGGRPKKQAKRNPVETHGLPMANPDRTHAEPIREEKRREEEKEQKKEPSVPKKTSAADTATAQHVTLVKTDSPSKGTRLPKPWALPKSWGEWALGDSPHWTPDIVRRLAEGFADHWHSKAGKDATKTDWEATWRNWCRGPIAQRQYPKPVSFKTQQQDDALQSLFRRGASL